MNAAPQQAHAMQLGNLGRAQKEHSEEGGIGVEELELY